MALIDVSFILRDPQFTDEITIIRRSEDINEYGEMSLEIEEEVTDEAVVTSVKLKDLAFLPDSARYKSSIYVYYNGNLKVESETEYADIVVWRGKQYQVESIIADWENWGDGWVKALCTVVTPHA